MSANGLGPALAPRSAEDSHSNDGPIKTELYYLAEDPKHKSEKPYVLRFDGGGVIPNTNMDSEYQPVEIHNFRPLQGPNSFDEYGFSVFKLNPGLDVTDYYNESKVKDVYHPAVLQFLWQQFPDATDIKILEHELRERHAQFPEVAQEFVEKRQPATAVHVGERILPMSRVSCGLTEKDYSPHSAAQTAVAAFQVQLDRVRRLLSVNVWKSIQGPGNDWPLAFCDLGTFDPSSELIASDVVFTNRYTENQRVYHSPRHGWYYYKDLSLDEVILFRQADSDLDGGGGVPHASFYNPNADENAAPRASIELRAFVIWE